MSRSTRTSETATPSQRPPATGRKRHARKNSDLPDDTRQQELIGSRKYPPLCPAPGTYVMER